MVNVPECDDAREEDRDYYDYDKVDQVIRNGLEINNIEIQKVVRSKGTSEFTDRNGTISRPRPLLVVLDSPQNKQTVLKNAKYLKECHEDFQQVGIAPDLTWTQRQKEKELRMKLKEKMEMGERGWYIRRGELRRSEDTFFR